jgi:hypothetical protein
MTVNTFPQQPTHVTPVTDTYTTIEEVFGSGVLCWVHAEDIYWELKPIVNEFWRRQTPSLRL